MANHVDYVENRQSERIVSVRLGRLEIIAGKVQIIRAVSDEVRQHLQRVIATPITSPADCSQKISPFIEPARFLDTIGYAMGFGMTDQWFTLVHDDAYCLFEATEQIEGLPRGI